MTNVWSGAPGKVARLVAGNLTDLGAGPVVLGALLGAVSYGQVYLGLAVVVLLSAPLYHAVHGRADRAARRAAQVPAQAAATPTAV